MAGGGPNHTGGGQLEWQAALQAHNETAPPSYHFEGVGGGQTPVLRHAAPQAY